MTGESPGRHEPHIQRHQRELGEHEEAKTEPEDYGRFLQPTPNKRYQSQRRKDRQCECEKQEDRSKGATSGRITAVNIEDEVDSRADTHGKRDDASHARYQRTDDSDRS